MFITKCFRNSGYVLLLISFLYSADEKNTNTSLPASEIAPALRDAAAETEETDGGKKNKVKFSTDGTINVGFFSTFENRSDPFERVLSGELCAKAAVSRQISGRIDFKGDLRDHSIKLDQVFIRVKSLSGFWFTAGNVKKFFSMEEMLADHEIITAERSRMHSRLRKWGVLGKDLSFQQEGPLGDAGSRYGINLAVDGDLRGFLNPILKLKISKVRLLPSFMMVYHYNHQNFIMGNLGLKSKAGNFHYEIEIFSGKNPDASDIAFLQKKQKVFFFSARSLNTYEWKFKKTKSFKTDISISTGYFMENIRLSSGNEIELLPGISFYFGESAQLRWQTAYQLLWNEAAYSGKLAQTSSYISSRLQLYW